MIPGHMYVIILIIFTALNYFAIKNIREKNIYWRRGLALLIALIQGWFLYAPNPFLDDMGSITHIDAYTNSILNTLTYTPFEMYSSSIYGHHGLLYLVPIKVLHKFGFTNWNALTLTIGIVGFVTFFTEYWCISQVIKNDVVYTIAVLANAVVSFQIYSNQYYQMMPHRYLFQALIIGGCVFAYRKSNTMPVRIIMWVLCGLAMLWNIETGMVVSLVWYLASVYIDSKHKGRFTISKFIVNGFCLAAAFIGGYCLVNTYNLVVGGNSISISTYIYPMGSGTYPIDMLQLVLMNPTNGYFLAIALMLGIIGLYLLNGLLMRMDERQFTVFLVAVMGFGVFTYYMNRAVTTNATIISFSMVLLLAHLCDRFVPFAVDTADGNDNEKGRLGIIWRALKIRNSVGIICMVVLSGLVLASIASAGATVRNKLVTTWNTDSLNEFMAEANEKIPADAVAFGGCTAQLFALMDRNTGIYIADWEDMGTSWANTIMNQDAFDKLEEILLENKYQHIVVNSDSVGYLPEGKYKKIESFEYNEELFIVYGKK